MEADLWKQLKSLVKSQCFILVNVCCMFRASVKQGKNSGMLSEQKEIKDHAM